MEGIFHALLQFLAVLFAISVHESAHAWSADKFGDPTGRLQGRITLNPLPHIDLIGTIILPLVLAVIHAPVFGWAKPVMVNPYNLRRPRRDMIWISAAGPISNLLVSGSAILLFLAAKPIAVVHLVPIKYLLLYLIVINIYLAVFNLIPIPPLDGSGILEGFLRGEALHVYQRMKPYSFFILLIIFYTNILGFIAEPILRLVLGIIGIQ